MDQNTSIAVVARHTLAIAALTVMLALSAGRPALADSDPGERNPKLIGAWAVQVTVRDCATNTPLGPPFNSLVTFHQGGTLSEAAGSLAFAAGQRSPGTGIWARTGAHVYSQRMAAMILFETPPNLPASPGFLAGWQTVTHTVKLVDADNLTSVGTNAFYNLSGDVYRTGCSTAVGRRFE